MLLYVPSPQTPNKCFNVNGRLRLWFNSFCFQLLLSSLFFSVHSIDSGTVFAQIMNSSVVSHDKCPNFHRLLPRHVTKYMKGGKCQIYHSKISLQEKIILPALASGNFLLIQASLHVMLHVFRPIFFIILYHYLIQRDCWNQDLLEKI